MNTVLQYVLYLVILVALAVPLGFYIKRVMEGEKTFLSRILTPCQFHAFQFSSHYASLLSSYNLCTGIPDRIPYTASNSGRYYTTFSCHRILIHRIPPGFLYVQCHQAEHQQNTP